MAIQQSFDKFNKKIYLTNQSDGYQKAKEKDQSIYAEIKTAFSEAGYPVIETFMQGSFAVNTAIHSLDGDFDIDRAIVIDAENAPEDPVEPKKLIKKVLEKRNFKKPRVKKPCVTADYQSANLHVDYTVYMKQATIFGDIYYLAVGKEGSSENNKEWSESDQKGLIAWIDSVDDFLLGATEKRKQLKRLIRYMKRWRDVSFTSDGVRKKIFSIGLTVMIKENYQHSTFSGEVKDDLRALKDTVAAILESNYIRSGLFNSDYRAYVKLPKTPERDIFQHKIEGGGTADGSDLNVGNQLRNKLIKLQKDLEKALNENDETKQCEILNGVFGDDFEVPTPPKNFSQNGSSLIKPSSIASLPTAGASGTSQGA